VKTTVGYTGGDGTSRPSYSSVCSGDGHSEALRIEYNPAVISYDTLLEKFWEGHDGTRPVPAQYASTVFVEPGSAQAESAREFLTAKASNPRGVATTVEQAATFHAAEWYHQHYHKKNIVRAGAVLLSMSLSTLFPLVPSEALEAVRQGLLAGVVLSMIPQLISSVFDPLFDMLERP